MDNNIATQNIATSKTNVAACLIVAVLCFVAFCFGWSVRGYDNERMLRDTITDTTTIVVYDTTTYRQPVAVDSVVLRYETIKVRKVVNDTIVSLIADTITIDEDSIAVEIPITQRTYTDSTYSAWVSGYNLRLDSIQVFSRTEYRTVTNTIEVKDTKRWGIGIQGGVGVGKAGISPYIGIGVQYNIVKW